MTLGILAQYLETRPDIAELIGRLSQQIPVVVYRNEREKAVLNLPSSVQFRTFRKRSSLKIKIWHVLFKAFGKVPRSKHNYFITEDFKIQNSSFFGNNLKTWWAQFLLFLNYKLPGFISYDAYIDAIQDSVEADLTGIDTFLCYTQIYDDGFFGKLVAARKKIYALVYSWDHPCKMKCFSKGEVKYLVWNENILRDLVELQGLSANRIQKIGTSQFGYLHQYLAEKDHKSFPPLPEKPYLYFAFATGTPSLARQEIEVIQRMADMLAEVWPDVLLMVRPYPFLKSKGFYDALMAHPQVRFEPEYEGGGSIQGKMNHKYHYMDHSSGFFHFGTTLGVEACFLQAPVFFLSLKNEALEDGLYYFIHQYQNDAYLHREELPNTIESYGELKEVLQILARQEPGKLMQYNQTVSADFSCTSFQSYTEGLARALRQG